MRILIAFLLVAGCAGAQIPDHIDSPILAYPLNETTLNRADVFASFDLLLRTAACGRTSEERAGFLVVEDGRFHLVAWPPTHRFHAEEWHGKIPNGTVAVVHTHPIGHPQPSVEDQLEARRVGVPMIVITPSTVVLVTDDGRVRRLQIGMTDEACGVSYTDRR